MRALLDQGLPAVAAILLRQSGWDVIHVREIGMRDSEDNEILSRCRAEGRFCVTLDKDFHEILASTDEDSPSVVLLRLQGLRAKPLFGLLVDLWQSHATELVEGHAITVTDKAVRVRRLPLRRK